MGNWESKASVWPIFSQPGSSEGRTSVKLDATRFKRQEAGQKLTARLVDFLRYSGAADQKHTQINAQSRMQTNAVPTLCAHIHVGHAPCVSENTPQMRADIVPVTRQDMIIYQSASLHPRIDDRRAAELEPLFFQIP